MHCFLRGLCLGIGGPPDVLAADTQSMPQMNGGKSLAGNGMEVCILEIKAEKLIFLADLTGWPDAEDSV